MILLLLQLFSTFFVIGLFTFGGGYAMLSLIQSQVVVAHSWLSESTFTDIVAISQMDLLASIAPPLSATMCSRRRAIPLSWA